MPIIPTLPSFPIPPLISTFFSYFPLVTYDSDLAPSTTPNEPTLWLIGPPSSSSASSSSKQNQHDLSLDPICRQLQVWARFNQRVIAVRWWSTHECAVGVSSTSVKGGEDSEGRLPILHLSNGVLLGREEAGEWLKTDKKPLTREIAAAISGETSVEQEDEEEDGLHLAYSSLLRSTLLPAVLASVYLLPLPASFKVTPSQSLPILREPVEGIRKMEETRARIQQIKKLRNGASSSLGAGLDLEEVEREGMSTIEILEKKMEEGGTPSWFGGVRFVSFSCSLLCYMSSMLTLLSRSHSAPTRLDAMIYALLSIILQLPRSKPTSSLLREKLESSPALMSWIGMRS